MRVPVLSLVQPTRYCTKLLERPVASISTALSIRHRVSNPFYAEKKTTSTNGGMVVGFTLPSGFAPSKLVWGRVVADLCPLDPFVENRTHGSCVLSCMRCLETRKGSPCVFKWLAKAEGLVNGGVCILSPYEGYTTAMCTA